jgi:hypothetical protein
MAAFHTQSDARRFFIERIIEQAARDGVALTHDEQQMLSWSESAPDSVADPALAERLAAVISDVDYEAKVGNLLRRSLAADRARDHQARDRWSDAWKVLSQGDHYILAIVNEAIGGHVKPWWR